MSQEIEYRLEPLYPATSVTVGLLTGSEEVADKSFILCVELTGVGGERLSPKDLNWSYSSGLDTMFMYVPATTRSGLVEIPRPLESAQPFAEARFRIRAWGKGPHPVASTVFDKLVFTVVLAPSPKTPTARTLELSGVLTPKEVSA